MYFSNPKNLTTSSVLTAKPNPALHKLFTCVSVQEESICSTNFFNLSNICEPSLTKCSYLNFVPPKFSAHNGRSTLWFIRPSTVHQCSHIPCANPQKDYLCFLLIIYSSKEVLHHLDFFQIFK